MRRLILPLKNAWVNYWRSITLGLFVFFIAVVMVVLQSFSASIKQQLAHAISDALIGHIQIRSYYTQENDMVQQFNTSWDSIELIQPLLVQRIHNILQQDYPNLKVERIIRYGGDLCHQKKRELTLFIGIDPNQTIYQRAFFLHEGRYLNSNDTKEILLTREQAQYLQVSVGDSIQLQTKTKYGLGADISVQVVGIGEFLLLSLFSYKACYVPRSLVQEFAKLDMYEVTDLIIRVPDPAQSLWYCDRIANSLEQNGIDLIITDQSLLKSDALDVTEFKSVDSWKEEKVKLSTHEEMGNLFKGIGDTVNMGIMGFMLLLFITVSFLIINLIYLMGIERYRDIGTLRTLGYSKSQVMGIVLSEILLVTLLFTILGIIAGSIWISFLGVFGFSPPIDELRYFMGERIWVRFHLWVFIDFMF
jgi:putative ABC transport system permease protein